MKFTAWLTILALTTILNTTYAADEMTSDNDETYTYCNEQAQMSGIEDVDEKNQYIKECIESLGSPGAPSGDAQQPDDVQQPDQ